MQAKVSIGEYVVARASELASIRESLASLRRLASQISFPPEGVEVLQSVCLAVDSLHEKSILDSVKVIHGDRGRDCLVEPILVVLPPEITSIEAVDVVNNAIREAGLRSGNGLHTAYFEEFTSQLAQSRIAVESTLPVLDVNPWDMDSYESEPDLTMANSPWVVVEWQSSVHEPDELASTGTIVDQVDGGGATVVINDEVAFRAFATSMVVKFPSAMRYGVPDVATDTGARNYVKQTLGFNYTSAFAVSAEDSGDDTPLSFVLRMVIHRDSLQEVSRERHLDRRTYPGVGDAS